MNHSEPTYKNQLWQARKLAFEQGLEALRNPHALIGETCKCGDCFCCAAWQVYCEQNPPLRTGQVNVILASTVGILCEKAVHSGDGFRQWVYPNLPTDYAPNPEIRKEAEPMMLSGFSAQKIADELYKRHA